MAMTPQQRKFRTVAKAANAKCHRETASVADYKKCMSTAMKAGLGGKRRKKAGAKKAYKACQFKSGPRKGRLKPGWRYGKGGRCVKAKG
jgi:hypothetical protein